MEEEIKQKKKSNKIILPVVMLIMVVVVIALGYNQILNFLFENRGTMEDQSTCRQAMVNWCNQCLSVNAGSKDFWNVPGSQAGADLATCSNSYFGNDMKSEQDCTGNALVYCSKFIELQVV